MALSGERLMNDLIFPMRERVLQIRRVQGQQRALWQLAEEYPEPQAANSQGRGEIEPADVKATARRSLAARARRNQRIAWP